VFGVSAVDWFDENAATSGRRQEEPADRAIEAAGEGDH
jgi:hypothetical protein